MPRVLCLHGMGSSARIFESQTAGFRDLLSEDYDFDFLDAPTICNADPGLKDIYPGPYRCWYKTPTTASMSKIHALIIEYMDMNGPYDAVMGFSQGAAVAASIMLQHQLSNPPHTPPIFKAGIFISSPLPFSPTLDHGIDTRSYFGIPSERPITRLHNSSSRPICTKVPAHLKTNPAYLRGRDELKELAASEIFYQMFHPENDEARIPVPTAHIYGSADPWFLHSMDVMGLCDGRKVAVLEHQYGHEIPRVLSGEICDVIETTMIRAL
ncbi:hypothetical protein NHQ30_008466 [Ciborinia camelliae]|nr:hypothetical protein NHQ30_008466 [Ciborinia camelliae]